MGLHGAGAKHKEEEGGLWLSAYPLCLLLHKKKKKYNAVVLRADQAPSLQDARGTCVLQKSGQTSPSKTLAWV